MTGILAGAARQGKGNWEGEKSGMGRRYPLCPSGISPCKQGETWGHGQWPFPSLSVQGRVPRSGGMGARMRGGAPTIGEEMPATRRTNFKRLHTP